MKFTKYNIALTILLGGGALMLAIAQANIQDSHKTILALKGDFQNINAKGIVIEDEE